MLCVLVSAGELNATSRGQQRFSTDDMLLRLTDDFQNQVKKNKKPKQVKKKKKIIQ